MKRYLVFIYAVYYPSGGMDDFENDFNELYDAKKFMENEADACDEGAEHFNKYKHGHIWDMHHRQIIFSYDHGDIAVNTECAKPDVKKFIDAVRNEIFWAAKRSETSDILHWWTALDDCFENSEFCESEYGNVKYRLSVLKEKGENIACVANLITPVLQYYNLI